MDDKVRTAFYGAGLSLIVGYLLSFSSKIIIHSMETFFATKTAMTFETYVNFYRFTPMSFRVAAIICTCIFLAIVFYKEAKYIPFIFSLISIILVTGPFTREIIYYGAHPYVGSNTFLSVTILNFLFGVSFLVLLIFSAKLLNNYTEIYRVRRIRMSFFILFGLSLFWYFLDDLPAYIGNEILSNDVYNLFFNILYPLELVCAVAAGILFIVSAQQKLKQIQEG